jgi:hypothetical protein
MPPRRVDVQRIGRTALGLTVVSTVVAAAVGGWSAAMSLMAGGLLVVGNLHLIRAIVSRLITRSPAAARGIGLVVLKLVVMVALVAAAFSRLPIEPVSFSAGVSVLVIAVVVDACFLGAPLGPTRE